VADKVQCSTHGEGWETFVCIHLVERAAGLGFNRREPDAETPYPDAWCDDCELIRAAHGGWNEESEKLLRLAVLCSGCYKRAHIRNIHPAVNLEDLARVRWRCHSCDEWHTGACLDLSFGAPDYWRDEYEESNRSAHLSSDWSRKRHKSFLSGDYCAIDDENFFVRGIIHLPIADADESFRWSVWGSLSRQNFDALMQGQNKVELAEFPPMFSWLSTQIAEYPDTLNLKMYAHVQPLGEPPRFELEPTDHPLSVEFYEGITPQRVKEIMRERLRDCE
jgi:hypothetical protein